MTLKTLKVDQITNELEGASLFFNPPSKIIISNPNTATGGDPKSKAKLSSANFNKTHGDAKIKKVISKHASMQASMIAKKHSITHANEVENITEPKGGEPASQHASKHDDTIETIRKCVKKVGREELFVRLSLEEKNELRSVVYKFNEMYRGNGGKTSENEISRIALKFLLEDYKTRGEQSILFITEEALNT